MTEILIVYREDVCRTPLTASLLCARLPDPEIMVSSAGTRCRDGEPMTFEARRAAIELGVDAEFVDGHRARTITEAQAMSGDLIITLARGDGDGVRQIAPLRRRVIFTLREFARLAGVLSDDEILRAANSASASRAARLRAVVTAVAGVRAHLPPPADRFDDDVDRGCDARAISQSMISQFLPAIAQVVRVVRLATHADQTAVSPGATTARAVRATMTRSPSSDQFSTYDKSS